MMGLAAGEPAPAFSLADEHGKAVDLPSTGTTTVLVFYRGDW
ncbi:MAG: hypothetical protein ACRDM0_02895 [Thermoleophilaceae bacterium]